MKAAVRKTYGGSEVIRIEKLEDPLPSANEVLVKVNCTTINRTDCANLTARPAIMRLMLGLIKPRNIRIGTDFAGEVVSGGSNFKPGDRVFGFYDMGWGTQAEIVAIPEEDVLLIPKGIDNAHAVAALEGAHYAHSFIHRANVQPGERVMINGASGAIGSALLQMVKQQDVYIAATTDTRNMDVVSNLGADRIIDYTKEDFTKLPEKFDYVFDTVGKSTFGKCKQILNDQGIYISSEFGPYAQNPFFALLTPLFGGRKVLFPIPYSKEKTMPYILELLKKNAFVPVIDRHYPMAEIEDAYAYVMSGRKTGNVILDVIS